MDNFKNLKSDEKRWRLNIKAHQKITNEQEKEDDVSKNRR